MKKIIKVTLLMFMLVSNVLMGQSVSFYDKSKNIFMQNPANFKPQELHGLQIELDQDTLGKGQFKDLSLYYLGLKSILNQTSSKLEEYYNKHLNLIEMINKSIDKEELIELQRKTTENLEKELTILQDKNRLAYLKIKNLASYKNFDNNLNEFIEFLNDKLSSILNIQVEIQKATESYKDREKNKESIKVLEKIFRFADLLSTDIQNIINDAKRFKNIVLIALLKESKKIKIIEEYFEKN